jgi:hypothetical protein
MNERPHTLRSHWRTSASCGRSHRAPRAELVARPRDDRELDEQAAARDVQAFISMMQEHGLLLDGEG